MNVYVFYSFLNYISFIYVNLSILSPLKIAKKLGIKKNNKQR